MAGVSRLWMLGTVFFLLTTLALAGVLIWREVDRPAEEDGGGGEGKVCAVDPEASATELDEILGERRERVSELFDPLSDEEYEAVRDLVETTFGLTPWDEVEDGAAEFLWSIDVVPAAKADVVAYLDGDTNTTPGRFARVMVLHGLSDNPNATEYLVGPLPVTASTPIVPRDHPLIRYDMRPVWDVEYNRWEEIVSDFFEQIDPVMQEVYGFGYDRVWWTDSAPRGYSHGDRRTWLWSVDVGFDGMYLRPLGIELLIDHSSTDLTQQSLERFVFNGQVFTSISDFLDAYDNDLLTLPTYSSAGADDEEYWSGMEPVASLARRPREALAAPRVIYPEGRRFAVEGRNVGWMGWNFHVAINRLGGIMVRNVQFMGERIAYELGLMDSFSRYSGYAPLQYAQYNDAGWGQGTSAFSLMRGIDCPIEAAYLDHSFYDGGQATIHDAVCIFEMPTGTIQRHYDQDFEGSYNFVSVYPGSKLVVLTTATVYNYDYTFRVVFHPDGTIEAHAAASGYVQAQWWLAGGEEDPFSHKIHYNTIGSLHDHQFLWKLDADILGSANRLVAMTISTFNQTSPWGGILPAAWQMTPKVDMAVVATEAEGSSTYDVDLANPKHFMLGPHPAVNNDWGHARMYEVMVHTHIRQLLRDSDDAKWFNAASWTKHDIWATVRKENGREERGGFPQFDMQAPLDSVEPFIDYTDGETLTGSDIVLWITHGNRHVPSTEDVPVTYSTSDGTGWTFRPYNYGRHSAIRDLRSGVVIRPDGTALNQGLPKSSQDCLAETPDLSYNAELD